MGVLITISSQRPRNQRNQDEGEDDPNGAADGIAPDSWIPALLLMLIAAYSVIAAVRLLRGGARFCCLSGGSCP